MLLSVVKAISNLVLLSLGSLEGGGGFRGVRGAPVSQIF